MRQSESARNEAKTSSVTGADLEKALAKGQFEQTGVQLFGMVKSSTKQGHINFAPAGCESWVDIPSDMIEEAKHVGHQACRDHSHPVFNLTLGKPNDPQAKILLALLEAFDARRTFAPDFYRGGNVSGRSGEYDDDPEPGFGASGFSARMIDNDFGGAGSWDAWRCTRCNCWNDCNWEWDMYPNGRRRVYRCRKKCSCTGCKETLW